MREDMRYQVCRFLNALAILILALVIAGAYTYQFIMMQDPCPLCELQRLSMIAASIGFMHNLLYNIRSRHYAITLAACIFGAAVSLRQISLHVCPDFATFGDRVLGFELYTWAFIVFTSCIVGIFALLMLHRLEDVPKTQKLSIFEKFAVTVMFLVTLANIVTTFMECGWGPCKG